MTDAAGPPPEEQRALWVQEALSRHESDLLRYAWRISSNLDAARDAVQETFLRLCQENPAQLDGHLTAWLYRVCRQRVIDSLRKAKRMSTQSIDEALTPVELRPPSAPLEMAESDAALAEAIAALPANQQEVVRLKFQQGLSYQQISEVTELSISNVGFLLHKAVQTLRARLVEN